MTDTKGVGDLYLMMSIWEVKEKKKTMNTLDGMLEFSQPAWPVPQVQYPWEQGQLHTQSTPSFICLLPNFCLRSPVGHFIGRASVIRFLGWRGSLSCSFSGAKPGYFSATGGDKELEPGLGGLGSSPSSSADCTETKLQFLLM